MMLSFDQAGHIVVNDQPTLITTPVAPYQPVVVTEGQKVSYGRVIHPAEKIQISIDPQKISQ